MPRGLVLIDHGSRHEAANAVLADIARLVRQRGESGLLVRHAHMELAEPTLADAIDACVADGADTIVVVPYFLGPGRHVTVDIPAMVRQSAQRHPSVPMRISEPLGVHPSLADVVLDRSR